MSEEELEVQYANAKAYLMQADKDGVSAYDQLTRLMESLLDENPQNVAGDPSKLHEILSFIQTHSFASGDIASASNEAPAMPAEGIRRFEENRKLFERPPPEVRTVIEQPDPYTTITTTMVVPRKAPSFPSAAAQNPYWTAAGCGMSDEEAVLLDCSITNLAMEKKLQDIQFVGKIFGTQADYFVLRTRRYVEAGESLYTETNTMSKPRRKNGAVLLQAEPGYVGANRYTFWVTSAPAEPWVKLPDVAPQQINAARSIKRFFTGDLTAAVSAAFPWTEAEYLRAQLARITSATAVAPQGALEEPEQAAPSEDDLDEDDDEAATARRPREAKYRPLAVPVADFGEEEIDVAELTIDRWVHAGGYLYQNGRETKVPERVQLEEEEEEEDEAAENGADEDEDMAEEEEPVEEEEEVELFASIQNDYLFAVVDVPQPPPVIDDDDEEEEEEEDAGGAEEEPQYQPSRPLRADDVADDDPTKVKIPCWTMRIANNISKAHRVAVVQSLRWPGATAFAAEGGKKWGYVYFGSGLKNVDAAYTPPQAAPVQSECADIVEVADPTAAVEKLVRRGEEVPEADSEADVDELEEEEDDDE